MKVKCVANTGMDLSQVSLDSGELTTTIFNTIKIGETYTVYGIFLTKGTLSYLTMVPNWLPYWHPAELFEVVDSRQPSNWHFKFYGYNDYVLDAIWGYEELLDENHRTNLILREENDLQLFLKKKAEIDSISD
ncbi:MAG: phosphoribosylaminoimidazole synthetase [Bacillota bacterium]|nr:phosphoribosylaminoimidazole synthetase [Bacillota bacterium]